MTTYKPYVWFLARLVNDGDWCAIVADDGSTPFFLDRDDALTFAAMHQLGAVRPLSLTREQWWRYRERPEAGIAPTLDTAELTFDLARVGK